MMFKIQLCLKLLCAGKKPIVLAIITSILVVSLTLAIVFMPKSKHRGGVVSNGKSCADIGGRVLKNHGSAVDAAIATLLCEGVMLPQSMGIGGGFVATIYTKSQRKIETIIARERAPAAATKEMFVGKKIRGAIATAVPGELMGYWEMHQKYGRLPWIDIFQPAIKLCKEGHWVSEKLERAIAKTEYRIRHEPSMAEIFIREDHAIYELGDYMKRPQLGRTLEIIAEKGVGELYDGGELAKNFTEDIQQLGGIITIQDLKDYNVTWMDANHTTATINGYTLYTTPLPTSGPLLAFMLNIMKNFYCKNEKIYWQRVIETFKHAYGRRSNLGDLSYEPDMAANISKVLNELKNETFISNIRKLIFDGKTFQHHSYYGASFAAKDDSGSANLAVLAANGDAITVTSTINSFFGAKVRSKRTGIILNDEMDNFSTPGAENSYGVPPSKTNYIKPGKRPMSSMCPSIILDKKGNVRLLVGAAGGTKITSSVATVILKYLVLKHTIRNSVDEGRMHHQLIPMRVDVEPEVPENIQNYLASVGHKLHIMGYYYGFAAVTAIGFRDGTAIPRYDKRRRGSMFFLK